MSDQELLIIRDDKELRAFLAPEASAIKADALALSSLVGRVNNPEQKLSAVEAQLALKTIIQEVERSRVAIKEPVLTLERKIDSIAREFVADLKVEFARVTKSVSDWESLQAEKARAAEAARIAELNRIEREREAAIAAAKSVQEVEAIRHEANQKALESAERVENVAPVRHEKQTVREEWNIIVNDVHTLAKVHPNCVKIEPLPSRIKELLNMGVKVFGITATKQIKSDVRTR